jgi:hypothetical protein
MMQLSMKDFCDDAISFEDIQHLSQKHAKTRKTGNFELPQFSTEKGTILPGYSLMYYQLSL